MDLKLTRVMRALRVRSFGTKHFDEIMKIDGIFEIGKDYSRQEIVDKILSTFEQLGGRTEKSTKTRVVAAFKKRTSKDDMYFLRITSGIWNIRVHRILSDIANR